MAEQRRIGYKWNLRTVMAQRNLWKSTELIPLLKSRSINLSESQVYRLVTGTPERLPARTFSRPVRHPRLRTQRPVRAVRRDARSQDHWTHRNDPRTSA
jgi:hypothetical protein